MIRTLLAALLLLPFAAGAQSAVLTWQHDGADLAGFRVYYGRLPSFAALTGVQLVTDPALRTATVDGLTDGTWYFALTALGPGATESGFSNFACVVYPSGACPLPPGPVGNLSVTLFDPSAGFRAIRFTVTKRRGATQVAGNSIQLADVQLMQGGTVVSWPPGTVATNPGGSNPTNERPANLIDANAATKALDFNFSSSSTSLTGLSVFVFTGTSLIPPFDGYRLRTANDAPERDPVSWTLEGSADGTTYRALDSRANAATPTARGAFTPTFTVTP